MNMLAVLPYVGSVGGLTVGVIGVTMAKRRDKDAAMTQQNKDIREIMVDMSTVKKTLEYISTKDDMYSLRETMASKADISSTKADIARVEAKVDQLINKVGS